MKQYRPTQQPDLVWLFDLDNTLHNASAAIFGLIDGLMRQSIQQLLDLDPKEADALRRKYWLRYGATLIGLVKHHQVCADEFLHLSHNFAVHEHIKSEKTLAYQLQRLPGRKLILTNAPANYAQRVLNALGITPLFERVISIEDMRRQQQFRPKPSRSLMKQVLAELAIPAQRCIFIDDTLRNLKAAYGLGIRTVHFAHPATPFSSQYAGRTAYVNLRVQSIQQLAQHWHQLPINL